MALDKLGEIELGVFYNETDLGDQELKSYEKTLPGFSLGITTSRFHFNHSEQEFVDAEVVVLTSYLNNLSQKILYSFASQRPKVVYWGGRTHREIIGLKEAAKAILSWPLRNCEAIAGAGKMAEQSFRQSFPEKPVFNIPYVCDVEPFLSIPRSSVEPPWNILYHGPINTQLGADLLFEAFEKVLEAGIDAQLMLVGAEEELPELLAELNDKTRKRVTYHGPAKEREEPDWLAKADLLVVPSRREVWGVMVNQAIASGLPVVVSDSVDAAEDFIHPRENGMVFPSGNAEELAESMLFFLRDPKRVRDAGLQSRIWSKRYTPQWAAQRWLGIFQQVLQPGA